MGTDSDKVANFIAAFDGDAKRALAAFRHYTLHEARRSTQPKRPLADEIVLEVSNLTKTYKISKQKVNALNGVSLQVHKGEFLALTGESGSGKSTLLQLMGGLDRPTSGSVSVHGHKLAAMHDAELSRFRGATIGFVFQFFFLQPFLKLRQNIEVAGMPLRTSRKDRAARVDELAQLVGLRDRLDHLPKELSGGQMQRAAIARALLNNPSIILADEPTGNLDSENSRAIIDLFEKIRDEFGTTIVVVTHDPQIAARADRALTMKDGVLV